MSDTTPARALSLRQANFVTEYLKDGNATQAAIRAGYARTTAEAQASRLLGIVGVREAIEAARADYVKAAGVDIVRLLREANAIALSDISKAFDPTTGKLLAAHQMPKEALAALASVKVVEMAGGDGEVPLYTKEVKLWDKPGAIFKLLEFVQGRLGQQAPNVTINAGTIVVAETNQLLDALRKRREELAR